MAVNGNGAYTQLGAGRKRPISGEYAGLKEAHFFGGHGTDDRLWSMGQPTPTHEGTV